MWFSMLSWSFVLRAASVLWADGSLAEPNLLFGRPGVEVEEPTNEELETRRRDFESMLETKGWIQSGDQVRPGTADRFTEETRTDEAWAEPPHRATIFLNFWGSESMTPGTNATLDESTCLSAEMKWPKFVGTEQTALALIEVFQRNVEDFGIRIAYDERPPSHLPYAMVMMGGRPGLLGLGGSVLGVSCSRDCGDRWWRDTTFAFTQATGSTNPNVLGLIALHEAAHGFGLAHIDDSSRIMNPFITRADVSWADECTGYDASTGSINCQPTHDDFCPPGMQNDTAELLAYFGPNSPDIEPPTVAILTPEDGLRLPVGSDVAIEAEVSDDHEGFGWKLVIPEVEQESIAFGFEKQWTLRALPEGVYTIRVEAIDHDRNESSDEVQIIVGDPVIPDGSDDGDDSSQDSDQGGSCAIANSNTRPSWAWVGLLGLALLGRRRRLSWS